MDPTLISWLSGIVIGSVASILASLLLVFLESRLPRKLELKVGGLKVEISGSSKEEKINEIVEKIIELQENPQVFISYNHSDQEFAYRLAQDLRSNGVKVWLADDQITVGDSIKDKIQQGISESQWVIVLISDNLSRSEWANLELELALKDEERRKRPLILPVLYQNAKLPEQIQTRAYADFRQDYDRGLQSLLKRLKPERQEAP